MPFYEYQCENCSEIYEVFLRNGERAPEVCEVCGGKLHKIISVSSFHLKGSGWYMTDYTKKNSPITGTKDNGSHSDKEGNSEKSGNSKKADTDNPEKPKEDVRQKTNLSSSKVNNTVTAEK